jgi:hypothetical protein
MSTRAYGSAGARLKSLTLRLSADTHPYYLHNPRGHAEPAPGWYWTPAGAAHPAYLGHNSYAAHARLTELLRAARAAAAGDALEAVA